MSSFYNRRCPRRRRRRFLNSLLVRVTRAAPSAFTDCVLHQLFLVNYTFVFSLFVCWFVLVNNFLRMIKPFN